MSSQPVSSSNLVTSDTLTATRKGAGAQDEKLTPRQRLLRIASSSTLTVIVILIAFLWLIPTIRYLRHLVPSRPGDPELGLVDGLAPPWNFTLANYQHVITAQGIGDAFKSSLIIAIPGTILPVLVAAIAAYAFAWMRFPGRDWIYLIIVALLVVPIQMTLIPNLTLFTDLGLTGSYVAIWLAHTAYGLPFAVYLLRNFFAALPPDLFESARVDGASHLRIFISILLPLSVPALASLVIFQFIWVWNDLLVALIYLGTDPSKAPLTVAVTNLVNSYGTNQFEILTTAAFISMALPLVIFFSLQRYFVRGILAGSVKG